jgi:pyruvate dehydrogenase E2 component (dihydrolipoamide acetyltransferase)
MPKLSDSMEQGIVLQWLIEDGQPVGVGDELVEIETDKATMMYEAEADGVLSIVVPAGTSVAVGDVIARVGSAAAREPGLPADREPRLPAARGPGAEPAPEPQAAAEPATNDAAPAREPTPALATPVARRLAAAHGVTLAAVSGSGPRGRITKADVLTAAGQPAPPPRAAPRTALGPSEPLGNGSGIGAPAPGAESHELTRTQQLIARRMTEAKATIPHFQVQTEVAMDRALALRAELKRITADADPVPSINDLIVRACALALRTHVHANGSYKEGRFELHERVNVGVAVATDEALIVPTVFDADAKTLTEIAADTRWLAARVRSGEITPPELSGATFTVSNLGMFGMTAITPVINPPQAAILGVGAIRDTFAHEGEQVVDRALLTLTLSCDHRILYGADAARFLASIKDLLEAPIRILL